ncbi:uncharacterized protein LTHEOB_6429 [Lasiodiplodia theobromae]|uniref:uncharacterized protein n=1 Tax=Lasiodiplodia theobromae TaxID=45133 RepID=UPI0015C3446D|nr:uncharacterized protein LTHEOB_6429 [Lasiodiplodia theobromae]KAF4544311.1 hypothetical protein LTHEOB_6429 [Lasiodiplodia theobromae]
MPKCYDQHLMEKKCILLIKCCDTSLFDMEHVYITCVSENKDRRHLVIKKGPSAPGRTRFQALRLLYVEHRCITYDHRSTLVKKGPSAFSGLRGPVLLDCWWKSGRMIGGI